MERIELFTTWEELKQYQENMRQDSTCEKLCGEWLRKFYLLHDTMRFTLKSDYPTKRKKLIEDLQDETYLSILYTAKFLKYSNVFINTVDLAYTYYNEGIRNPFDIEWIKEPDNLNEKVILKLNKKEKLSNREREAYKARYLTAQKKMFERDAICYNREDNTIPYFLYQMTYYILFTYGKTCGIGEKSVDVTVHRTFCNGMFQSDIMNPSKINNLLYKYKLEKVYKPWVIHSYQEFLKINSKRGYYSYINWSKTLELYNVHMPYTLYEFCLDAIAATMCVDNYNHFSSLEEQIKIFVQNFHETIEDTKDLSRSIYEIKRYTFCKLYEECSYNIDNLIQELENVLSNREIYKWDSIDSIRTQNKEQMKNIFSKLVPNIQPAMFHEIEQPETVERNAEYISKIVPKDCHKLFVI